MMTDNPFADGYSAPQYEQGDIFAEPAPSKVKAQSEPASHITYFPELEQGSDQWLAARCGLLTASEMKHIITPTLKVADNDKTRGHVWELLAQRITRYVEPTYISDDMLRGMEDELEACILYSKHFAPVDNIGFITNNRWGFTIGYSPDGLVGKDGLVEVKSRRQKFQVKTIADWSVPPEYMLQLQTGLLVSERQWIDFISYSGGLAMVVIRVHPDPVVQEAIVEAASAFEAKVSEKFDEYNASLARAGKIIPTKRRIIQEMTI